MREPKESGNGLKSCWACERLDRRCRLFFFFPTWCQQPETRWHCFPGALSFAFSQLLLSSLSLDFLRAAAGWCFQALLSPEHSSVWSFSETSFLSLSFCRLCFCSPLPPLSIGGGYFWILSTHELSHGMVRASRAPGPCLAGVTGMGSPCRPESIVSFSASPVAHRASVLVVFLGLQPVHTLFGQYPILLVLRRIVGKLNYLRMHSLRVGHWSLLIPGVTHMELWEIYCFGSTLQLLNWFWPLRL